MNRNSNHFTPLPGFRRFGLRAHHTYGGHRSLSGQATPDDRNSGVQDPPRLMDDATPTGLNSAPNFPTQVHSRQQINVFNGSIRRGLNPRVGENVDQSPPRAIENPRPAVLGKLKKEIYEPPKISPKRVSLCYKDSVANALKERERERHEGRKRCAICLEDFESQEEVMLTPCGHVFHEDCIVPWVASKGQCPVCRFVIYEKTRDHPSSFNNNNIAMMVPSDLLIAGELLSFFRAMQGDLPMGNGP